MASSLGESPFFLSVQRGLALALPLVMAGSLALMLREFPCTTVQAALDGVFGPFWHLLCDNVIRGSFGIASLAVLCSFAYSLAALHNQRHPRKQVCSGVSAMVVLSCFFIVTAPRNVPSLMDFLSLDRGLLVGLLVAAAGGWLFMLLARCERLRLPMSAAGQDPVIHDVLAVMPAGVATLLVFGAARTGLDFLGPSGLHDALQRLLAGMLQGGDDGLGMGLVYMGLSQVFWFFGAHGPNLMHPVEESVLVPAAVVNMKAFLMNQTPPFIVTKPFIDAFARMGGSGSTMCLILAVLLRAKDGGSRRLCLLALAPALLNVNEPLLFGLPLVFNPVYAIPTLVAPLALTAAAYAATVLDLVPRTVSVMSWTVPPFLSGYTAVGSLSGAGMQAFNLVLGTLIYLPFVSLADRMHQRGCRQVLRQLSRTAGDGVADGRGWKCLGRPGAEGRLAKTLADDLRAALKGGGQLFLEYQPQCAGGLVVGVEALLRWNHPAYGLIPPPVAVALAEDAGLMDSLGLLILKMACAQRAEWAGPSVQGLTMAVNLSPMQLQDPALFDTVASTLEGCGLPCESLELEITESVALLPSARALATLRRLRQAGVRVAIDDFGMGHASLRYLKEFPVDVVKIDRSLTMDCPAGVNGHIVESIVGLSGKLGFKVVVEGVETREQYLRFKALGCGVFQGYYFSRSLPGEKCRGFIRKLNGA